MAEKKKLVGVQYLRGIAALMVAYFHLRTQIPAFTADLSFDRVLNSDHLSTGVYVFFVISGFIMYVTGRNLSASDFVRRRLVRILPLYWSLTLAVCAVAILAPHLVHRTDVTAEYVAKSMLFVPYSNPSQDQLLYPVLVPGWSLNYEMGFYALFAAALLAPRQWRTWIITGALGICALAGVIHSRSEVLNVWGFYTSSRLLLFAAGIGLGVAYTRLRLSRWVCAGLVLAGFWMILGDGLTGKALRLEEFLGSVAIVAGLAVWEHQYGLPTIRALLLLGDASYSLYLVHIFVFGITRTIWRHLHVHGAAAFATFSMLAAVGAALMTYTLIEVPSIALLKGRLWSGVKRPEIVAPNPAAVK